MAKLTDAQTVLLTRGAQREDGLIQPAPKTPAHMAHALAKKLVDAGMVERVDVFHEQAWCGQGDGEGFYGYRVTPAGFRALGIDESEWPDYATPAATAIETPAIVGLADADEEPAGSMYANVVAHIDGTNLGALPGTLVAADGVVIAAAPDDERREDEAELANPQPMDADGNGVEEPADASYQPIEAALVRAMGTITANAADVSAWARFCADHAELVAQVRGVLLAANVAKPRRPAREVGAERTPREGTKQQTVVAMLQRQEGASNPEIQDATGWAAHTVRGFLAGLKKKGMHVESKKEGKETLYKIVG
jgi:hypothetical protein